MSTYTPSRYPAGHADAGRIIVDPEDAALSQMDAMPTPATPAASDPTTQRPLSALLPGAVQPEEIPPPPRPAMVAAASLVAVGLLLVAFWGVSRPAPLAPRVMPTAAPTAPPTPAATSAPTITALPPDAAPRALVGWFDYQDAGTAVAIERGVRYQVIGRAGMRWLLITTEAGARVWALAADLDIPVDLALPDLAPPAPLPTARPAPAAQPAADADACTEATAPYRATVTVPLGPRPGDVGGYAVAWSCTSQQDAQDKAEAGAADIRAKWATP